MTVNGVFVRWDEIDHHYRSRRCRRRRHAVPLCCSCEHFLPLTVEIGLTYF